MDGMIFDIQRNSFVDGPGIRTTVFFKGCNLRCAWCHNPESISPKAEILCYPEKCTGCGRCRGVTAENSDFLCFSDGKKICGKKYTSDEVLKVILKDKSYYNVSKGGVTFSGGECMLQVDFLSELLKKCKENDVHTAVDTAGNVPKESFERVLPYADMFLFDIKMADSEKHRKYTGAGNERILENFSFLANRGADIIVRTPIIDGVNDTEEEMQSIKALMGGRENVKIELLPYHKLGGHKYAALGKSETEFTVPSEEKMKRLKSVFGI